MVKHYNPSIAERLLRLFKWKGGEQVDSEVSPFIQPTIEIKPRLSIFKTAGNTVTTALTVYTTPTDKEFFLTNLFFSYEKNAACDNVEVYVSVQPIGTSATTTIADIATLSLTASRDSQSISFETPLQLTKGTIIYLVGAFTVGAMIKTIQIQGYTEDS